MRKNALLAGALASAVVACSSRDFNKPAILDNPRILAVQAEPPQPGVGQIATLSTLLYQPPSDHVDQNVCPPSGVATYSWDWCPVGMVADMEANTYVCPLPEDAFQQMYAPLAAALGLGPAPPFHLGEGETMPFTNPFPPTLLAALCRGDISSSFGGSPTGGSPDAGTGRSIFNCDLAAEDYNTTDRSKTHPISFNITVKVTITPACPALLPAGFSPLAATYSMHLPTTDLPGNQNPVISGIFATENYDQPDAGEPTPPPGDGLDGGAPLDAGHDAPDGGIPLPDDPVVMVKRDKHVGLQLDMSIDTAEHLAVPAVIDYDSKKNLTRHYEHLAISWYAEAGDFTGRGKGRNTGFLPTAWPPGQDNPPSATADDIANFEFNTTNTWDLPKTEDYGYHTARITVVVRDGRGGVGWTSKQVSLENQP
jgi:hypothetical protein